MPAPGSDASFTGSIPELYDTHLVPLIFEPYAADLARRVAAMAPLRVLEVAAGTGVVTRAMVRVLPSRGECVATDLNQAMLDRAAAVGTERPVRWQQADAMQLPFENGSFDLVVCQFGVMFFPDKVRAYSEARRVLRHPGALLFNVWDSIESNEFGHAVEEGVAPLFPDDPPRFLGRTPYGYFDRDAIGRELRDAGFTAAPRIDTVKARSRAATARIPALAFCQGTPLRNELLARGGDLERCTQAATAEVERRFGSGPVESKMQALVILVAN